MKEANLKDLLVNIDVLDTKGDLDCQILGLSISSNSVEEGHIFFALVGEKTDGHLYIDSAIKNGTKVIVCEKFPENILDEIVYIKVKDSKKALAIIASDFYENPSSSFKLLGVTGTNGKTTVATLLYNLFSKLGYKCGLISTVGDKVIDKDTMTKRITFTTPDSISLNKMFAEMRDAGCTYVFMEASSHALEFERMNGVVFAGGIFTNLTHDHLDFHKSFENYRDAKKKFFNILPENTFALSNIDDPSGEYVLRDTKAKKYFYGLKDSPSNTSGHNPEFTGDFETKLIGEFNMYNMLAVYATAVLLGQDKEKVKDIIKNLDGAPGRFESIKSNTGVTGVVDYSHTPDALENVLKTIHQIVVKPLSKIITVVGCGGDRDKAKRPVMAKIGYDLSDILILTSDNPRTEKAEDILNDMRVGISSMPQEKVYVISDRHEAIEKACELAKHGDYILLAGKGHEDYQEINGKKTHFSDMEELKNCFDKMI